MSLTYEELINGIQTDIRAPNGEEYEDVYYSEVGGETYVLKVPKGTSVNGLSRDNIDSDHRARFVREIRKWEGLRQDCGNIIIPLSARESDEQMRPFMAYRRPDRDLESVIRDEDQTIDNRMRVMIEVLEKLRAIHDRGYILMDLTPKDIVFSSEWKFVGVPSSIRYSERYQYQTVVKVTEYTAPERINREIGEIGYGIDLWAIGVMMHWIVNGKSPYDREVTSDTIRNIRRLSVNVRDARFGDVIGSLLGRPNLRDQLNITNIINELRETTGLPRYFVFIDEDSSAGPIDWDESYADALHMGDSNFADLFCAYCIMANKLHSRPSLDPNSVSLKRLGDLRADTKPYSRWLAAEFAILKNFGNFDIDSGNDFTNEWILGKLKDSAEKGFFLAYESYAKFVSENPELKVKQEYRERALQYCEKAKQLGFDMETITARLIQISGKCGQSISWRLDGTVIKIVGSGSMDNGSNLGWKDFRKTITEVTVSDGITRIGDRAFMSMTKLSKVALGRDVRFIGEKAFYMCTSLTDIQFPASIENIGMEAFVGCSSLKRVNVHNDLDNLDLAFDSDCIVETATNRYVESWQNIPGTSLEWMLDRTGVLSIRGRGAMSDSSIPWVRRRGEVRTVAIYDGVTSIGSSAFTDCTNLTDVMIPESVATIGFRSFNGCKGLRRIRLPRELVSIGDEAFFGCDRLNEISMPDRLADERNRYLDGACSIITYQGQQAVPSGNETPEPVGVTEVDEPVPAPVREPVPRPEPAPSAPSTVTTHFEGSTFVVEGIGDMPEESSPSKDDRGLIAKVIVREGVTSVAKNAFRACNNLREIVLPDSLRSIGMRAFANCPALEHVRIPRNVSDVGGSAFSKCKSLAVAEIPGDQNLEPLDIFDPNCEIKMY